MLCAYAKLTVDFTSADLWLLLGMKKSLRMTSREPVQQAEP